MDTQGSPLRRATLGYEAYPLRGICTMTGMTICDKNWTDTSVPYRSRKELILQRIHRVPTLLMIEGPEIVCMHGLGIDVVN